MLRTHKGISVIMTLCLCIALLAPVFVAPPAAQAAVTYQALSVPVLQANVMTPTQNLGVIQVDIDNCAAIRAGDVLTFSFSSEIGLNNAAPVSIVTAATAANTEIVVPLTAGGSANALLTAAGPPATFPFTAAVTPTKTTLDITFTAAPGANPGRMLIYFKNVTVGSVEGDISAMVLGPANGAFTQGSVTVAKIDDNGGTNTTIKSAKTFGSSGGVTDTIIITETIPGRLPAGDIIKLKLPNGFRWVDNAATNGSFNWGYAAAARGGVALGAHALVQATASAAAATGATPATVAAALTALGAPGGIVAAANGAGSAAATIPAVVAALGAGNTGDVLNSATLGGNQLAVDAGDNRILQIRVPAATTAATGSGQIRFSAMIAVDDAIAKEGDVTAALSDTQNKVTEADIVVAKYASYSVKVVEDEVKELLAGKANQKIGKFNIQEGIAGSLLANRSIKLTLPTGVKWWAGYRDQTAAVQGGHAAGVMDVNGGVTVDHTIADPIIKEGATIGLANADTTNNRVFLVGVTDSGATDEGRTIKFKTNALSTTKAKIQFENLYVDVSPDFTGDLIIKVTSDAGVNGEVKVATVKPRVELKGDNVKDIRIGEQAQELGDLIITETKKEAITKRTEPVFTNGVVNVACAAQNTNLNLTLPAGATWGTGFPKVEIVEGDLDLDTASMSKIFNAASGTYTLRIPVKSESTKPSKIKISGMKATLDRTIPEGDFKITVSGLAVNETGGQFNNVDLPFAQFEGNKAVVARCVTPAPNEGTTGAATGQFRINSNIYQVNGTSKVMDAAPYVKNGRTYVPVRFMGYAMGLTDADIVYDQAAQKATLTLGDKKVELTVGSTTITVNGEAKTMDVAPEISSDRMMLPARYVAEGLGFQVGWDQATGTVLISK